MSSLVSESGGGDVCCQSLRLLSNLMKSHDMKMDSKSWSPLKFLVRDTYKRICVMMVMNVEANANISHQYVAPVL